MVESCQKAQITADVPTLETLHLKELESQMKASQDTESRCSIDSSEWLRQTKFSIHPNHWLFMATIYGGETLSLAGISILRCFKLMYLLFRPMCALTY